MLGYRHNGQNIMKKYVFSWMATLFAIVTMVSLTSCSSDNDEPSPEEVKSKIVGLWQSTHISGWAYDDTPDENLIKVDRDLTDKEKERYLFNEDGTGKKFLYLGSFYGWQPSSRNGFSYSITNNKININYSNGNTDTYSVVSIKDDVAILEITLEDGEQYKTKLTLKKVS